MTAALRAVAAAFAFAAAAPAAAGPRRDARPWFAPDRVSLQLAGEVGVVSPGVGWELGSERIHADLFVGFVPEALAGRDLWSTTAKLTLAPFDLPLPGRWRLQPLAAGAQLTYTFGDQYFVENPDRYPERYYTVPTALHGAVLAGGNVRHGLGHDGRALGFYWELVALDTMLRLWADNRATLGLRDVVTLALGAWLRL